MLITEVPRVVSDLPERDRGMLAAWLLDSLPPHGGGDASDEGVHEALRRRQELDIGRIDPLSAEEFWASIDAERTAWR